MPNISALLRSYLTSALAFTSPQLHRLHQFTSLSLLLALPIYYFLFKEMPLFVNMLAGQIVRMLACIFLCLLSQHHTFGLSDLDFLLAFGTLVQIFVLAFLWVTLKAAFVKIVPERCEATMVGTYVTVVVVCGDVVARGLTWGISGLVSVDTQTYEGVWKVFAVRMGCLLIPMLFVGLLPSYKDVIKAQNDIKVEIQTNV